MHRAAPVLMVVLLTALALPVAGDVTRAVSDPVEVTALAVAETDQGFVGVHAVVEATALAEGTGQVFVSTKPVAEADMQGSARLAAQVAAATLGLHWRDYDYLIHFQSDSVAIGGPSAGGDMTLALTVALHNLVAPDDIWRLDPAVAATGTIAPDGTIGPVGGVPAKAEAAKAAGVTEFLFPAGLETASTQVAGRFGPQVVTVEMAQHCGKLGITCTPVATLREVLRLAAHVDLAAPAAPVPATNDYAAQLRPTVEQDVAALADKVDGLSTDARVADLARSAITGLDEAQQALAAGQYYLAATKSFQGSIAAGQADAIAAFYDGGSSDVEVKRWISQCDDATRAAHVATDGLKPDHLNALYAIGAAQQRTSDADDLLAAAKQAHDQAFQRSQWVESIQASVFCVERAGTAQWWAGLADAFGQGPAVGDLDLLAQDVVDQAQEMTLYASAVGVDTSSAQQSLAAAQAHLDSGRPAAAIVEAVSAHSQASVAIQAPDGNVPPAVLDAARQAASNAVAHARAAGAEPMLPVSLVELAGGAPTDADALGDLWSARSLALVGLDAPAAPTVTRVAHAGHLPVLPFLAIGIVIGVGLVGLMLALVPPMRRL